MQGHIRISRSSSLANHANLASLDVHVEPHRAPHYFSRLIDVQEHFLLRLRRIAACNARLAPIRIRLAKFHVTIAAQVGFLENTSDVLRNQLTGFKATTICFGFCMRFETARLILSG